jgi:hypothetical protein
LNSAMSKTAQTEIKKGGENVNGADPAGGAPSHGRGSDTTWTQAATGRFGNIARTSGIGGTRTATGFVPKENDRPGLRIR